MRDFQIQGPAWMDDARFEIIAKLPAGSSQEQTPEMMQALLANRFKLTLRRDSKEHSVYALTVGRSGAKLKPAEMKGGDRNPKALGPDAQPRPIMMFWFLPGGVRITAPSARLASVAELMSRFTERPVIDMTGIEGLYDFDLSFAPETTRGLPTGGLGNPDGTASDPAPSVFDAVKQYGLNLEPRKASLEMLKSIAVVAGSYLLSIVLVFATNPLLSRLFPGDFVEGRVPSDTALSASTAAFVAILDSLRLGVRPLCAGARSEACALVLCSRGSDGRGCDYSQLEQGLAALVLAVLDTLVAGELLDWLAASAAPDRFAVCLKAFF